MPSSLLGLSYSQRRPRSVAPRSRTCPNIERGVSSTALAPSTRGLVFRGISTCGRALANTRKTWPHEEPSTTRPTRSSTSAHTGEGLERTSAWAARCTRSMKPSGVLRDIVPTFSMRRGIVSGRERSTGMARSTWTTSSRLSHDKPLEAAGRRLGLPEGSRAVSGRLLRSEGHL